MWSFHTSFKMAGVRTSPATSKATETPTSNGKLSSTQFLCFWAVESPGVHNLSPRLSWVKLISPTRHAPQTINEIKIVIQGLPPTALPNLWKHLTAWKCFFLFFYPQISVKQMTFFASLSLTVPRNLVNTIVRFFPKINMLLAWLYTEIEVMSVYPWLLLGFGSYKSAFKPKGSYCCCLTQASVAQSDKEHFYSPLDGMASPSQGYPQLWIDLPVPIYISVWREALWE